MCEAEGNILKMQVLLLPFRKEICRGEGKYYLATLKSSSAPKWIVWFVSNVDGFD